MDTATLLRFLSGTAPADERSEIERWIAADPGHRTELERLERLWQLSAEPCEPAWDTQALWHRIESRLDGTTPAAADDAGAGAARSRLELVPDSAPPMPQSTSTRSGTGPRDRSPAMRQRSRRFPGLRAAAAVALVAGGAAIWWLASNAREQGMDAAMRTFATQRAERLDIRLADGSRVVLGPAGSLRVPDSYGRRGRDVYLEGEAYFEVTHHADRPFRVHTARSVSEDLGTRFSVTAFSTDSVDVVAVAEGVVGVVGAANEPVVLDARDVARVSANGAVSAQRDVDVDRYFSWLDDRIVFEDALLADAIPVLERRYDIEIHVVDSALIRRRFTGTVSAHLDESLSALATVLDAKYQRTGRVVTLTPADPSPR